MYKIKYIFILILLLLFACDNMDISSNQENTFVKLYGSWSVDAGKDVKEFNNGYMILATISDGNQNTEIVLYKTNKFGNLLNNGVDTLSSVRGGNNTASKLLLTDDGGFIVLGTVEDTLDNNFNIYINKFNASSESEWEKFIGTNNDEKGVAIKNTQNGYIIAGSTNADDIGNSNLGGKTDILLVKVNLNGDIEWEQNYGGSGDESSSDVVVIENGYLVVGTTNGFHMPGQANNNIILIKTNQSGGAPDMTTYGGSNDDFGSSIVKVDNGGYVIVGTVANITGSSSNIYVVKIEDNIHEVKWEYANDIPSKGYDIIESDGSYIIVGSRDLTSGTAAYFLKLDDHGTKINENFYGGYGQVIYAIEALTDGGYIMTGSSGVSGNEMVSLIKVNADGEL